MDTENVKNKTFANTQEVMIDSQRLPNFLPFDNPHNDIQCAGKDFTSPRIIIINLPKLA